MAKMQIECGNCAKKFFTNIIKVYVFKLRYCPDCHVPMFCDNDKKTLTCPQCKRIIELNDVNTVQLKTEMKGTSRDFEVRNRHAVKGYEIQKLEMPEKRVCTRCRHLRIHIQQTLNKDPTFTKSVLRELNAMSDTEFLEAFFKHVQVKLRENLAKNPQAIKKIEQRPLNSGLILEKSGRNGN
jgi:uncharacterized protein YbaR (Trm112 family)